MNKNAIKKFAIEARKKLIASVSDKAGMLGITAAKCNEPKQKGTDYEVYETTAGTEVTLNKKQCEQRRKLTEEIERQGYEAVMEEVAYTWFNRICAIRFMEVNDYLPTRVRVLSSEKPGKTEPDIITVAPDIDLDFTETEKEAILDCKLRNNPQEMDELFQKLFIRQCNKLSEILPELFEKTEDYSELLLNISYTDKDDIIYMLVNPESGIPEEDFNVEKSGQVEIIGWLYQYYNEERKNEVINIYKGTVKKEDIPAATQLFTTDWVVRYMVDNSLGRYWVERNPESKLADKLTLFIKPKSGDIAYIDEKIDPTEITFIDPCMGSGHILVYAFDVLMEIYRECGYSDRDAALNIVQNNLFGLDIDRRAHQLAYFAVMMKARSYNRRALTQRIFNNLCEIRESNGYPKFVCEGITTDVRQNEIGQYLLNTFRDAKELGSLISVEEQDYKSFAEYLLSCGTEGQIDLFQNDWNQSIQPLCLHLTKQAAILSKKYCVVATNPPYLGKMQGQLKKFVTEQYKDYSGDLFAVFMYHNFDFCKKGGYSAFMTPFVWMFIKTYEKLRNYIIQNKSLITLVQMEYSAFEEATVPICSFVLKNEKNTGKAMCIRLSDFMGGMEVQKEKVLEAIKDKDCGYFYEAVQENFEKIPGSPVAYWVSDSLLNDFSIGNKLKNYGDTRQGMATSDNSRFLRKWHEILFEKLGLDCENAEEALSKKKKWFPYNKGGEFRKWYGNIDYTINYENDGFEVKEYATSLYKTPTRTIKSMSEYFKPCLSWSKISSGSIAFRYYPKGFIFDVAGCCIFYAEKNKMLYDFAFLNSKVSKNILEIISPTLNYEAGHIASLPIIDSYDKEGIINCVDDNISLAKTDWDSFETSWDFKFHPLVVFRQERSEQLSYNMKSQERYNHVSLVSERFRLWENECNNRFNQLKSNEEELNRIFIDIYGLQDELTPEVEDKDVTVRKADLQRDIRSLISYAVGCMFGRYSLEQEGLVYAGGEWPPYDKALDMREKNHPEADQDICSWTDAYGDFIPDLDNVIPITDEEYFTDDIVSRFCDWLKVVYGADTLEENLDFIAQALGNKGDTSREVIRNYFLNDFMADHMKIYQKRPIYWLFDSGKANGFKALIYMHRYNADTVGRVRTDYLHKAQAAIEQAMHSAEYVRENGSGTDKAKATKQITKYTKQLGEIRIYDEAMAHIANQRIVIDLDDGVKVNYEKFQGVEVAQEGKKALKVDLLAKIK